jgi:hypothetical protein
MIRTGQPLVQINATLQLEGAVWKLVDLRVEHRASAPPQPPWPPLINWRDRLAEFRRGLGLKTDAGAVLALQLLMRHRNPEIRLYAALIVLSLGLPLFGPSDGAAL